MFTVIGLDKFEDHGELWDLWFPARALMLVGDAIAEDARLRLEDDVTATDGSSWDPWSDDYAKTRGPQNKLLFGEGDLAESITARQQRPGYVVGSELPYALTHQFGSKDGTTVARPYVGVSGELEDALDNILPSDFDAAFAALV